MRKTGNSNYFVIGSKRIDTGSVNSETDIQSYVI